MFIYTYIIVLVADITFSQLNSTISPSDCGEDFFDCKNNGECIPAHQVCNYVGDCSNGADEVDNCNEADPCPPYAFLCTQDECVDFDVTCNGIQECGNDEQYLFCPPILPDCGTFYSDDPRAIFPWHAGVWLETNQGPVKICAASIISPKYVISAVDCFWNFTGDGISTSNFTITGELRNNTFKQAIPVKKVYFNDYHSTEHETNINNIAVVELDGNFLFNDYVSHVCVFDYKGVNVTGDNRAVYRTEMVTWTPGPNNYNGPQRLELITAISINGSIHPEYLSEIQSSEVKHVHVGAKCGPVSDHGGGMYFFTKNVYYLHGIINPPLGDETVMSCVYRIVTYLLPSLTFLRSVINLQTNEASHNEPGPLAVPDLYRLDASVVPPSALFENCGKFDMFRDDGSFPWHAVVWDNVRPTSEIVCSATIIKENVVISAASCYWDWETDGFTHENLTATAGYYESEFTQFREVSRIVLRDFFSTPQEENINNIAILVLDKPFYFGNLIGAVCLYSTSILDCIPPPIQHEGYVISMQYSCGTIPQQMPLEFRWNNRCANTPDLPAENFKLCMFAIPQGWSSGLCVSTKDSGAGLFVIDGGTYYLRGILNPIKSSAAIFTNILPYVPFIEDIDREIATQNGSDTPIELQDIVGEKDELEFSSLSKRFDFVIDFSDCKNRTVVEDACDETAFCEDGYYSFSCSKNGTINECQIGYCRNNSVCTGTVGCN